MRRTEAMAEGGPNLNLSCSICFEEFQVPKMLPCGHTFCCQCVSKMADRNSSLKCPTCRKDVSLPVSGRVEDFPTNYALMNFIPDHEALNENVDAVCKCTTHKTPMEFYCKSCEKQICAKCLLNDHKPDKHNIATASDIVKKLSGELQKLEKKLQHYKEEEKLLGENILKGRDYHQQDKERLKQEIKITLEREREQLKKAEENLLNELNKKVEGHESTYVDLQTKYNTLQTLSNHIKKNCKEVNQCFQKLNLSQSNADLEKVAKSIDHLQDAIESMKTTCQSTPTNVGLKFVPGRSKYFGSLTTVPKKPIILESTTTSKDSNSQNPRQQAIRVQDKPLAGQNPEQRFDTTNAARMKRGIAAQQATNIAGNVPLTVQMLAQAQPHEQKRMLGERLFSIIKKSHGGLAGKITGMLLEIDNAELLHMLESPESLRAKVDEAVWVLVCTGYQQ